jgi:protein CpxP
MKKIVLTLVMIAAAMTATYAQNTKAKLTAEQKAEKSTAKLQTELSLSADQKQKVYAIELDKFKKADEWHKKTSAVRKAQKEQHKTLKNETDAKLAQVLNADQKKKLEVAQTTKKDKKGGHKKGHKAKAE